MLANHLSQQGHRLVVIDPDEAAFQNLSSSYSGYKIVGTASELAVLEQANIRDANYFFAVTSKDNLNLMAAQVAKHIYNVPQVVARVYDPAREALYAEFGIDTISPIHLSANAFLETCTDLRLGGLI
jgi:trk system potassium uptake protein TrkA